MEELVFSSLPQTSPYEEGVEISQADLLNKMVMSQDDGMPNRHENPVPGIPSVSEYDDNDSISRRFSFDSTSRLSTSTRSSIYSVYDEDLKDNELDNDAHIGSVGSETMPSPSTNINNANQVIENQNLNTDEATGIEKAVSQEAWQKKNLLSLGM
jgi:hypothetical protein